MNKKSTELTVELIEKIKDLYKECRKEGKDRNESICHISKELNVKYGVVTQAIKGVKTNRSIDVTGEERKAINDMLCQNYSVSVIAKELGIDKNKVDSINKTFSIKASSYINSAPVFDEEKFNNGIIKQKNLKEFLKSIQAGCNIVLGKKKMQVIEKYENILIVKTETGVKDTIACVDLLGIDYKAVV